MNRRPLGLVAAAYAAVVLWVTIGPAPWRTEGHQLDGGILNPEAWTAPVTWTTGYLAEIAFNVAIFLPVGVLAALLTPRRRWPLAMAAGFGFTVFIELVQVLEPARISDPRDLVMNTTGAVLGVLIVVFARGVRRAGLVAAALVEQVPVAAADAAAHAAAIDSVVAEHEHAQEHALATAQVDRAA
ncbi:VanZ family protein [Agromyces cerinus]|uniref:VanZ like family protein n=1 Tax=Agromyces cerinus subsp. cerinus TaxID=232089 RepID=A0A1N6F464_9MICO|nr:VanZ family protein [Agromyces cerinus]SIN90051.1 VanZ like family protein [Agromyces cerinus subsp. cerinus]